MCRMGFRSIFYRARHRFCCHGLGSLARRRKHTLQAPQGLESCCRSGITPRYATRHLVPGRHQPFTAVFQLVTFALVTEVYSKNAFSALEHAKPGKVSHYEKPGRHSSVPGLGYVLNTISWVAGFLVGAAVIVTGIAADRGHKWAAGNRAYQRIRG